MTTAQERCSIGERGDPHFCIGYRCQLWGICDHNRRLDEAASNGDGYRVIYTRKD